MALVDVYDPYSLGIQERGPFLVTHRGNKVMFQDDVTALLAGLVVQITPHESEAEDVHAQQFDTFPFNGDDFYVVLKSGVAHKITGNHSRNSRGLLLPYMLSNDHKVVGIVFVVGGIVPVCISSRNVEHMKIDDVVDCLNTHGYNVQKWQLTNMQMRYRPGNNALLLQCYEVVKI